MSGGEVHDPPEYEAHDFQRTIPSDGRWCQRCGLAEARWVGEPCIGRITPEFFEAELVEVRSRLADTEAERHNAVVEMVQAGLREAAAEARVRVFTEALTALVDADAAIFHNDARVPFIIMSVDRDAYCAARALLAEEVSG